MPRIVHVLLAALVTGFLSLAAFAQQSTLTVGTATADRGQKATGFIDVPAGADPGTQIPVVIVRGAKPGN